MSNTLLPMFVRLDGLSVVVIGGGRVASAKVEQLHACACRPVVVSPELHPEIATLVDAARAKWRRENYGPTSLEGADLVIAATDDGELNRRVSEDARRMHLLVNVVDHPELCTFYMSAAVTRGDVKIAVSTHGKSPALARRIRDEIADVIGPEYGRFLEILASVRDEVQAGLTGPHERRRRVFDTLARSDALALLKAGDETGATARIRALVRAALSRTVECPERSH